MVKSACATIFFGIAGCGKSFLGQLFASKFGVFHYELDQHLTPTMPNREKIKVKEKLLIKEKLILKAEEVMQREIILLLKKLQNRNKHLIQMK